VDEIMRRASQLLALTSHQMGFVETPAVRDACVRSIEVMPVAPTRFAFLIADSLGRIHSAMSSLGEPLMESDLSKLRAFLNETLRGVSLDRVHEVVANRVALMHDENRCIGERALTLAGSTEAVMPGRLYMEGATQLFEQPEFQEHGRAKEVFSLLDEREKLMELLRASMQQGRIQSSVLIGEEVAGPGMRELSVVASPYYAGDKPIGAIGILGPKRMPYNRLTALVDYTAGLLSRLMTRLAG
jgi:heat-inducible transcriptional repressor